jgi:hypothetical protein
LLEVNPEPEKFRAITAVSRRNRDILVRLWLTEGIPFAFRRCPAVYEEMRGWLGSRLEIHPKQITLLGSARLGFSLAPPPEFGRAFNDSSDLDLSAVSDDLFLKVEGAFNQFKKDYSIGIIVPRNEIERTYWDSNIIYGSKNIDKGFFDVYKIPTYNRYPISQQINNASWVLINKLNATADAPKLKKASIRIYKNWSSLIDRVSYNLFCALKTV